MHLTKSSSKMKKNSIIINLMFFLLIQGTSTSFTQNIEQGVYLSAKDFNNKKISYSPMPKKKYKMDLNDFFNNPTIKITIADSSYTFHKDSIFAYRDKENRIYRLYGRESYEILNPKEKILIYSHTSLGGNKNTQSIVKYYFSSSSEGKIQTLTKWNLKTSFPTDSVFHELLDMYFRTDDELMNYDSFYKIYKINRAYQFSKEEKHSFDKVNR